MPRKSKATSTKDEGWRFLAGEGDLSSDKTIALLASCVANQQRYAGFGDVIDIREFKCPDCKSPGFNTGMGITVYTCGSEWLPDDYAKRCAKGIEREAELIAELTRKRN